MKIRSHTGNMVEARVGMVVSVRGHESSPVAITMLHGDRCTTEAPRGFVGLMNHPLSWCTMLSCPFMVGDEVKANTDEWGFIGTVKEIGEQDLFVAYCGKIYVAPKTGWLHSNPDLRSKGEV